MEAKIEQDVADLKKSDAETKKNIAVLQRDGEATRAESRALHEAYTAESSKITSQVQTELAKIASQVKEVLAAMRKDMSDLEIRLIKDSRDREADSRNRDRWVIGTVITAVAAGVVVSGFIQNKNNPPQTVVYTYPPAAYAPAPQPRVAPAPTE